MSEEPPREPEPDKPDEVQQVRAQHLSARVPESVSEGVFSTGVIIMTGGTEFVVDFVQNLGHPPKVAARVVIPHAIMPQFIDALRRNLDIYQNRYGPLPAIPKPQEGARRPSVQEIYDELKLSDDKLSGAYANGLMVGHTASEFKLDFLTNLYPNSAVSCRVFLSAPQIPRMIQSFSTTYQQLQQRFQKPDGGGDQQDGPDHDSTLPDNPSGNK